jgi:hypothetical protein
VTRDRQDCPPLDGAGRGLHALKTASGPPARRSAFPRKDHLLSPQRKLPIRGNATEPPQLVPVWHFLLFGPGGGTSGHDPSWDGWSGSTAVGLYAPSVVALPCFAPPPPWSVGSAHIASALGRSSPKGPLWPKALLPPEPSTLAGWYGVAGI